MFNDKHIPTEPQLGAAEDWEAYTPITDESSAPVFPLNILPATFRHEIAEYTRSVGFHPDIAVFALLFALSAAFGAMVQILSGSFRQRCNLYAFLGAASGSGKSPAYRYFLGDAVQEFQHDLRKQLSVEVKHSNSILQALNSQVKELMAKLSKSDSSQQDLIKRQLRVAIEECNNAEDKQLFDPEIFTGDITPETLQDILGKQNGRIAILSDESGGLANFAGRYSSGVGNWDVILQGWDGGSLSVHRANRRVDIQPFLTVGLMGQPSNIKSIPQEAVERGFMARFLFSFPNVDNYLNHLGDYKASNDRIKALLKQMFSAGFQRRQPVEINLDAEGAELFNSYRKNIQTRMQVTGDLYDEPMRSWAAKLPTNLLRIIGIVHVANELSKLTNVSLEQVNPIVDSNIVKQVTENGDYFIAHAKRAFDTAGANVVEDRAKQLLKYLVAKATELSSSYIEKQRVWQAKGSLFNNQYKMFEASLQVLVSSNAIRIENSGKESTQGRKKEYIQLSPFLLKDLNFLKSETPVKVHLNPERTGWLPSSRNRNYVKK